MKIQIWGLLGCDAA